jgi:hypothetical protein
MSPPIPAARPSSVGVGVAVGIVRNGDAVGAGSVLGSDGGGFGGIAGTAALSQLLTAKPRHNAVTRTVTLAAISTNLPLIHVALVNQEPRSVAAERGALLRPYVTSTRSGAGCATKEVEVRLVSPPAEPWPLVRDSSVVRCAVAPYGAP